MNGNSELNATFVTTIEYYDARDRSSPKRIWARALVPDDALVYARHGGAEVYGVFESLQYGELGEPDASRLVVRTLDNELVAIPGTVERSYHPTTGRECRLILTRDVDRFELIGSRENALSQSRRQAFLTRLVKGSR